MQMLYIFFLLVSLSFKSCFLTCICFFKSQEIYLFKKLSTGLRTRDPFQSLGFGFGNFPQLFATDLPGGYVYLFEFNL